jgi:hypothetical protein
MFGPRRPRKTCAYYGQTVPAGSDIDRGSSSTLGIVTTLGGTWPGLGRRYGRKDLHLEGGCQHRARAPTVRVSPRVPTRSGRLGWPLRSLSQLSPEDLGPAHGLGSMTPGLVPLADNLDKLLPPPLHFLGQGSHLLPGRRSLFSSHLRLLSMPTPLPPASAHRRAAEGSTTEQERP